MFIKSSFRTNAPTCFAKLFGTGNASHETWNFSEHEANGRLTTKSCEEWAQKTRSSRIREIGATGAIRFPCKALSSRRLIQAQSQAGLLALGSSFRRTFPFGAHLQTVVIAAVVTDYSGASAVESHDFPYLSSFPGRFARNIPALTEKPVEKISQPSGSHFGQPVIHFDYRFLSNDVKVLR